MDSTALKGRPQSFTPYMQLEPVPGFSIPLGVLFDATVTDLGQVGNRVLR